MSEEPIAREAMRRAEHGARADASRLVASVPDLVRSARGRRAASRDQAIPFDQLALQALPRLATGTAIAVAVAALFALSQRLGAAAPAAAFESAIVGAEGDPTGDVVLDTLLDLEGIDG